MINVQALEQVISKGLDENPAIRFGENWASFRIGNRQYDPNAKNKTRWSNITVKVFGGLVERIRKMGLKEGSMIHLFGELREESWEYQDEKKHRWVLVASDIQFAGSGGNKDKADKTETPSNETAPQPDFPADEYAPATQEPEAQGNFTGFSSYSPDPSSIFGQG